MSKTSAIILIVLLFLSIGYSTYYFFKGDFERGFLPFPLLAVCYVFIVSRRRAHFEDDSDSDEAEKD